MTFNLHQFYLLNTEVVNQTIFHLVYVLTAYLAQLPYDQCLKEIENYNTVYNISFHDSQRPSLAIIVIIQFFLFLCTIYLHVSVSFTFISQCVCFVRN
jgi:hypothetical protein